MPDIVEDLPAILLDVAAAALRQTGFYPRPQVHMFAEDLASPYIGYIVCRPFYRGEDAVTAIAGLGLLPSVMGLTRLLVVWEDRDLRTALEMPRSAEAARACRSSMRGPTATPCTGIRSKPNRPV
jgi:hypothetical protein